jgi:hypothetical protein
MQGKENFYVFHIKILTLEKNAGTKRDWQV